MSTVNTALLVTETTNREKRQLFEGLFTIPDVSALSLSKSQLSPGQSLTINATKLFVCSVNIPILIQIQVGSNTISFTLGSSLVLPLTGTVTITNPIDNSITVPAVVSYVAI